MLVYNCKLDDSVSVKTLDNDIKLSVEAILNKPKNKAVQLGVTVNGTTNRYFLDANSEFSVKIGEEYLQLKIGYTSPTKTTLYVGALNDAMFKFIKGSKRLQGV